MSIFSHENINFREIFFKISISKNEKKYKIYIKRFESSNKNMFSFEMAYHFLFLRIPNPL
jgi:hypothetical protein